MLIINYALISHSDHMLHTVLDVIVKKGMINTYSIKKHSCVVQTWPHCETDNRLCT